MTPAAHVTSVFVNWWPASKAEPGSLVIGKMFGGRLRLEPMNCQFAVLNNMNGPSPTATLDAHVVWFASHHCRPSFSSPWTETGSRSMHGEKHRTLRYVKQRFSDGWRLMDLTATAALARAIPSRPHLAFGSI